MGNQCAPLLALELASRCRPGPPFAATKILFAFDDPKAYSQPWSITFFYKLKKDWVLDAHPCTLSAIKEYDDKLNHRDNLPGRDFKPQN